MPEPENPLIVPFETVISPDAKSVDASDRVKLSAMEASLDVSPDDTVVEVIETVGAVPSYVQLKAEEAVLPFDAASLKLFAPTEIEVGPSAAGVKVAV